MSEFDYPWPDVLDPDVAPGQTVFDWRSTVLSQYANSPILMAIVRDIDAWLDQSDNVNAFYNLVWNIDSARGYGLDVWGRIVGVNRVLTLPAAAQFGFEEAQPGDDTFGYQGLTGSPFSNGVAATSNYALSDEAFRLLIFAKAAANITNGSIKAINAILRLIFVGSGPCFVSEPEPTPYFGFAEALGLQPNYIRSFTNSTLINELFFGFEEGQGQPFNQAVFQGPLSFVSPTDAAIEAAASFYNGTQIPHMTMALNFGFTPTPVQLSIALQSTVVPKPVGVSIIVNVLAPGGSYQQIASNFLDSFILDVSRLA